MGRKDSVPLPKFMRASAASRYDYDYDDDDEGV